MKARINSKKIISCLSTIAIATTIVPWTEVFALTPRIASGTSYTKLKNKYNPTEYIEKTVDLYFLPSFYTRDGGWTLPDNLPTSYTIPELNDYTWNIKESDTIYKYDGQVFVQGEYYYDTANWCFSDVPEDTGGRYVYGINSTTEICYKFRYHNYAYTLREQEMDRLIAKYIKPDMTDYEKVCTAAAIVSAGIYGGGDPILTKSGDCIDSAYAMVYLLRKMGITARSRMNDAPNSEGYNHHNNFVLIDGEIYVVDGTCHYKADTALTFEQRVEKEIENLNNSYYSNVYIRKVNDHWAELATSTWHADNSCWYKELDDGTLRLDDIFGLDGDTSEVWTFPTSTSINGTTYRISKIGNIGWWTCQNLSTDLNVKGTTVLTCLTDSL